MNPVLYDKSAISAQDFSTLGLGTLGEAISCVVSEKINGYFTLEMEYPEQGVYANELAVDNIIAASVKGYSTRQLFRICRVEKRTNTILVSAEHISYQLKYIPVTPYTASSASAAFSGLLSHSAVTNPFDFNCNISVNKDFKVEIPTPVRSAIYGEEGILATYGGEIRYNNYHVYLDSQRGGTADTDFEYGKNITNIVNTISIEELGTSICPYYYEDGTFIMLTEKVLDKSTASNYSFKRVLVVDMTSYFDENETPSENLLRTKATAYLNSLSIGYPENGIDITPILLSSFTGYEKIPENIGIGDSVVISYAPLNLSYTDRITAYEWDVILERYIALEIGDNGKTFADYVLSGDTTYVGGGSGGVVQIIDSAMSDSSVNAVMNRVIKAYVDGQLATKVDKVTGKGLSTNDYTTADKNKLAGIQAGAEVNQNAFSNITVGTATVAADSKTDTLTLTAGTNITLTANTSNDSVTISADTAGLAFGKIHTADGDIEADSTSDTLNLIEGAGIDFVVASSTDTLTLKVSKLAYGEISAGGEILQAGSMGDRFTLLEGTGVTITANTSYDEITINADTPNWYGVTTTITTSGYLYNVEVDTETGDWTFVTGNILAVKFNEDVSGQLNTLSVDSYASMQVYLAYTANTSTRFNGDIKEGEVVNFVYEKLSGDPDGHYIMITDPSATGGGGGGGVTDVVAYDVPQNIGTSLVNGLGVARIPYAGNNNWGLVKIQPGGDPPDIGTMLVNTYSSTTVTTTRLITADYYNGTMRPSYLPLANNIDRGAMSAADYIKLGTIATSAEVNQNAFSNITVGTATISADSKTDTLTLTAGTNITLTADTANDSITISASGGGGGVTDVLAYDEDGTTFSVVVGGEATIPKAGSTYGGVAIQTQNDALHLYWNGSNKWIPTLTGPYGTINASWVPLNATYPVGAIFETTKSTDDPSVLFGGTWQLLGQFVTDNGTELTTSEGLLFADGFGSVKQTYKWERIT